jgi:hypothetical protein
VITKSDLKDWTLEALRAIGGSGRISDICKHIWEHHEQELRSAGTLFYTWQYDMRWAAQKLQDEGKLSKAGKNHTWYLTP